MSIPSSKVAALTELITQEMFRTPAPFFGVNIVDVNESNLDEFNKRMMKAGGRFVELPGFQFFFRTMSDYGSRKRILAINRYDQDIDPVQFRNLISENEEALQDWAAVCEVIEDYEFFTACEIS